MATPSEISSRMITALSITEPELDIGVGTPLRKILDTVAEAIAETTVDAFLTTYQYDIDSRSGADLDAFGALFGFYRQIAKRASGTILLQRTTPAPESILIPSGAQASSNSSPPVVVRTVVPSVFPRSSVVLEVSVEAVEGGSFGNVAAGTISLWLTSIEGITSITNPAPLTGGSDTETDEQFRDRLKKTFFRNLAGTKDMYIAIGLAEKNTTACDVYGAYERWTERIEIANATGSPSIARNTRNRSQTVATATNASPSVVSTAQPHDLNVGDWVWISGAVGNTAINGLRRVRYVNSLFALILEDYTLTAVNGNGAYTANSATLTKVNRMSAAYSTGYGLGENLDFDDVFAPLVYTIDFTVVPPVVTATDPATVTDGVYELSFMYTSQASRNFPNRTANIIADRVDVWVDGETIETATVVAVLDSGNTMDTNSATYPKGAFRRRDGRYPNPAGAADIPIFLPLPLGPIDTVPETLTLGDTTYTLGTHYWIVDRVESSVLGSMEAKSGLEFTTESGVSGHISKSASINSTSDATPVVVTTAANHDFHIGQRVKVVGAAKTVLNTDWYISAVTANTLTLEDSTAPGGGAGGAQGTVRLYHPVALDYMFNSAPMSIGRNIEEWRLAGSNVLVHKAQALPLRFHVAVILMSGYSAEAIQPTVDLVVGDVLKAAGIGGVVQISDVLAAISQVAGIDAVRMVTGSDFAAKTITATANHASGTNVTTSTAHGFSANQLVEISGVTGTVEINGDVRVALVVDTTHFVVDVPFTNAWVSGGTARSASFGTHVMSPDGTRPLFGVMDRTSTPPRPTDIQANDSEHFVLHSVVMTVKAQNSWI